jgi:hypothetical protein
MVPRMGTTASKPCVATASPMAAATTAVVIATAARTAPPLATNQRARDNGPASTTSSRLPVSSPDQPDTNVAAARPNMSEPKLKNDSCRSADGSSRSRSG